MTLQTRPPVITIMGHVDHGKTTLLDYIRKTKVTAGEAGGITQHTGAYSIEFQGKPLTFIDTPGHAAFNKMRERGARVTDLIVLVVAANDGVKPQTIESIRHIKNSGVPYIVAINKMDLPNVDPNIVKSGLAEHEVIVNDYGGTIETVEISALNGTGVDQLLETLLLMAELEDLKADPEAPLKAVVIESSKTQHRGSIATVIVQQGTLRTRTDVIATGSGGEVIGRVKQLMDETGQSLEQVLPGFPAEIMSFNEVPAVGSEVRDLNADYSSSNLTGDENQKQQASASASTSTNADTDTGANIEEAHEEGQLEESGASHWDDFDFDSVLDDGEKKRLKLIVKADVDGTLEAILQNLDEDSTQLISSGVGEVTERDLDMAETSGAVIIAFQLSVPGKIRRLAKERQIKIKRYDIIYKLIEDLQKQMLKLLDSTIDEKTVGEAEILEIFEINGNKIAGIRVKTGEIKKNDKLHIWRDGEIIADPMVRSMQHGKDEVDRVGSKGEAGLTFRNKNLDFKVGDTLTAYIVEDDDEL